ncbi:MAG TPA: aldose 1-epimerase [Thermoleophilaceae bacterium]|jgi:galactose mutarotase-like enzyme
MTSRPPEGTIALGAEDGLRAAFAPAANMVLHSLTLGGRELLAQRNGLEAYAERGSTMGVPLLHPWANRLAGDRYSVAGTEVELPAGLVKRDPSGLPIHGAPPGLMRWEVVDSDEGSLFARLDWDSAHPAFAIFPFPHRLDYAARLSGRTVEIAVTLTPAGEAPVPVSFGFHPYLRIQATSREAAMLDLPVRRRLVLGESMIPTGDREPFEPGVRQLGDSDWDDGFADLGSPPQFVLGGGDPEVCLTFLRGYPFAQVFAPPGSDFVCFEPMTAPTNALVTGGPDLPVAAPGDSYEAAFEIAASAQ